MKPTLTIGWIALAAVPLNATVAIDHYGGYLKCNVGLKIPALRHHGVECRIDDEGGLIIDFQHVACLANFVQLLEALPSMLREGRKIWETNAQTNWQNEKYDEVESLIVPGRLIMMDEHPAKAGDHATS